MMEKDINGDTVPRDIFHMNPNNWKVSEQKNGNVVTAPQHIGRLRKTLNWK
jgi:hypothetical protein